MQPLRTAILEHTTATGVHHDWLIEDPRLPNLKAPDAKLWTARVTPPPQDWPMLKRIDLTTIAPHRRDYLTYQGPIAGGRGRVRRIASGICFTTLWANDRIVLTLKTDTALLDLQIIRQSEDHWLATIT